MNLKHENHDVGLVDYFFAVGMLLLITLKRRDTIKSENHKMFGSWAERGKQTFQWYKIYFLKALPQSKFPCYLCKFSVNRPL